MLKNALLFLLGFGCAAGSLLVFHPRWWPEPHPERKLEGVYLATRSIEGAIAVGVTRPAFDILVQKLSTEILLADDRIDPDSNLGAYRLMAYKGILKDYERSSDEWGKGNEKLVRSLWDLAAIKHKTEIARWK